MRAVLFPFLCRLFPVRQSRNLLSNSPSRMMRFLLSTCSRSATSPRLIWLANGREMGHGRLISSRCDMLQPTYKLGRGTADDAYLGGEKRGKRGRGAANKTAFVNAVETSEDKPIYTQLRSVAGFTREEIKAYAAASIEAGARVATDGFRYSC